MHEDEYREEVITLIFEQWLQYRSKEEWLMEQIVKSRGTTKSAFKRHLKEIRKMIKRIEGQLFDA